MKVSDFLGECVMGDFFTPGSATHARLKAIHSQGLHSPSFFAGTKSTVMEQA
jgi:hypothetical protein